MAVDSLVAYALGFGVLGPPAAVVIAIGLKQTAARYRRRGRWFR